MYFFYCEQSGNSRNLFANILENILARIWSFGHKYIPLEIYVFFTLISLILVIYQRALGPVYAK